MNTVDVKFLCKRVTDCAYSQAFFASSDAATPATKLTTEEVEKFKRALRKAIRELRKIGMQDGRRELERIQHILVNSDPLAAELKVHAETAWNAIVQECGKRRFLRVEPSLFEYVDNDALFGPAVHAKFAKARDDRREAGNCLAADCNTAAVFHLMRASEHALRTVARALRVKLTHKGTAHPWSLQTGPRSLPGIKSEVAKAHSLSPGPRRDRRLNFYSNVADKCEYMRDIWRNAVSHTRRSYNAAEALAVKLRVEAFMMKVADGLSA
jgi:hypothetical protein